ncbi:SDR family oxidoreductase [Nocardioides sp.]|uniref:SDR family oxidoreductase n=1 Tax=Nocardioides sp. TaxID=35761 RepID=UPI0035128882
MTDSRTYVVSGAASGIGAATTTLLRNQGHEVITVDLHPEGPAGPIDVAADLGTPAGRAAAVAAVAERAPVVHGIVPAAGVAGLTGVPSDLLVRVNYFGALALVRGLRPQLAAAAERDGDAAVVLLASNSITGMPGWTAEVAAACLREDEAAAIAVGDSVESVMVYPGTKAALAWWARRDGIGPDWAGTGIRVNSVAPGKIATPMTERLAADPVFGPLSKDYPSALGRDGRPEEIAAPIAFLLSPAASLIVGACLFIDGGTDAILHPLSPEGWEVGPITV